MSRSFSDTISILIKLYPQKISRIISLYTVDLDVINKDNKNLEQKIRDLSRELYSNRELSYFTYLSDISPISDSTITGSKIKSVLYNHLIYIQYKDMKWIQVPDSNKCIVYKTYLSENEQLTSEDEQYMNFITGMMNKAFPDLFVKIEDEEIGGKFVFRVKVFWV